MPTMRESRSASSAGRAMVVAAIVVACLVGIAVLALATRGGDDPVTAPAAASGQTTEAADAETGTGATSTETTAPTTTTGTTAPPATSSGETETSSDTAAAAPAPADGPVVRLAVAGDVGTGESEEYRTSSVMDGLESTGEFDALLLLGDNVYNDGNPDELDRTVFEPFAAVLDANTMLLPVLGNHDVDDGYGAEQIDAIGMPHAWYATTIGDVLILSLDSNTPYNSDQLEWLDATLAASTQTWKIATMHHPPYSAGEHGSDGDVRETFVPLFEEYGVQLALAGHDHDYQRSTEINGVTYIVSGGAAKLRDNGWEDFTEFSASEYHFLDIAVFADHLDVQAIDHEGTVLDEVTLAP